MANSVERSSEHNGLDQIKEGIHPALSALQGWLQENAASHEVAENVVRGIQGFTAHVAQVVHPRVTLGISAEKGEYDGLHAFLTLLWPEPLDLDSLEQSRKINALGKALFDEIPTTLRKDVAVHLYYVSPADVDPAAFEHELRESCADQQETYLGILRIAADNV